MCKLSLKQKILIVCFILLDVDLIADLIQRFSEIFKGFLPGRIYDLLKLVDIQINNLPYSGLDYALQYSNKNVLIIDSIVEK